MTPEQLRELKRLAALAAANVLAKKRKKRGERIVAVEHGPATEARTVVRCVRCNAPLWADDALRNANGDYVCALHAGAPLHAPTSAYAICSHCREHIATGVWRYGGMIRNAFGRGVDYPWHRDAALCAACGFGATTWVTLIRPELPKGMRRGMTPMSIIAWHRKNPPKAARYVEWCRLTHDGREAAATFASKVQEAMAPPAQPEPLFDMTDPVAAWTWMHKVGLVK